MTAKVIDLDKKREEKRRRKEIAAAMPRLSTMFMMLAMGAFVSEMGRELRKQTFAPKMTKGTGAVRKKRLAKKKRKAKR